MGNGVEYGNFYFIRLRNMTESPAKLIDEGFARELDETFRWVTQDSSDDDDGKVIIPGIDIGVQGGTYSYGLSPEPEAADPDETAANEDTADDVSARLRTHDSPSSAIDGDACYGSPEHSVSQEQDEEEEPERYAEVGPEYPEIEDEEINGEAAMDVSSRFSRLQVELPALPDASRDEYATIISEIIDSVHGCDESSKSYQVEFTDGRLETVSFAAVQAYTPL